MALPPDSLSFSDLGGTKLEYTAPVDTSTDRSANEVNLAFAAAAALTRTAVRSWLKFSINGSGVPTLVSWDASWKGGTSTPPVPWKISNGKYLITFPTTVLDEQGTSHTINFNAVTVSASKTSDAVIGAGYVFEPQILTANTIRLYITNGTIAVATTNIIVTMFII